jgi:hypothetical protein
MEKKSYVVYNGQKTGIYTSWVDCYSQANNYKNCVVRLYDKVRDGQNAWNAYNSNCLTSLQTKRNIEAQIDSGCGYYNDILSNILEETGYYFYYTFYLDYSYFIFSSYNFFYIIDREAIIPEQEKNVLMKKDIQEWLQSACFRYRIEQPLYVLHDHKYDVDGKRYYRYRGSLTTPAIVKPKVCLGEFARTREKARDKVVAMLLRRLLSSTNHKLIDYNYHNVILLENQLEKMTDENYELHLENSTLMEEIKYLNSRKHMLIQIKFISLKKM